jgi:hypothetical protein
VRVTVTGLYFVILLFASLHAAMKPIDSQSYS